MKSFSDFFLVEDRRQALKDKYLMQAHKILTRGALDMPAPDGIADRALTNIIDEADPTPNKMYADWAIRQWITSQTVADANRFWEDIPAVRQDLELYHRVKQRMPAELRDINKFKSYHDLRLALVPYAEVVSNKEIKRSEIAAFKTQIKIVYDGPEGKIYIPTTKEASKYLGRGTKWCTAAEVNNYFQMYNKDGPLYVFISPDGQKRQLHISTAQFMNELDVSESNGSWVAEHKELIKKIVPSLTQDEIGQLVAMYTPTYSSVRVPTTGSIWTLLLKEVPFATYKKNLQTNPLRLRLYQHLVRNNIITAHEFETALDSISQTALVTMFTKLPALDEYYMDTKTELLDTYLPRMNERNQLAVLLHFKEMQTPVAFVSVISTVPVISQLSATVLQHLFKPEEVFEWLKNFSEFKGQKLQFATSIVKIVLSEPGATAELMQRPQLYPVFANVGITIPSAVISEWKKALKDLAKDLKVVLNPAETRMFISREREFLDHIMNDGVFELVLERDWWTRQRRNLVFDFSLYKIPILDKEIREVRTALINCIEKPLKPYKRRNVMVYTISSGGISSIAFLCEMLKIELRDLPTLSFILSNAYHRVNTLGLSGQIGHQNLERFHLSGSEGGQVLASILHEIIFKRS